MGSARGAFAPDTAPCSRVRALPRGVRAKRGRALRPPLDERHLYGIETGRGSMACSCMLVRVHKERMLVGGCFESAQQECDSGAIHEARLMTRAVCNTVAGNDKAKTCPV